MEKGTHSSSSMNMMQGDNFAARELLVENNRKGTIKNNINDDDTFDEREKVNKKTATSPNIP